MPKSIITTPSLNVLPFWPGGNIALTTWHRLLTRRHNFHPKPTFLLLLSHCCLRSFTLRVHGRENFDISMPYMFCFYVGGWWLSRLANMTFLKGTLIGVRLQHWDAPVGYHTIGHLHMTHIMCPYKTTCQRTYGTFVKTGGQPANPTPVYHSMYACLWRK